MNQQQINEIRDFNRFYARLIGLLDKTYLNSPYSLAEVRVLGEIYHNAEITANDILTTLQLDKGYLSRILKSFEKKKMVVKKRSTADGRALKLSLTAFGEKEFLTVDQAASNQVNTAFSNLSDDEYRVLIASMTTIKAILKDK